MRNILILGVALLISSTACSQGRRFLALSKAIYKKNGGHNDPSVFKLSRFQKIAREKVYQSDSSSFLKDKIDTLYLLEGYNIETGIFYGTIWNKINKVSYKYFRGGLTFEKYPVFSAYQVQLISQWDTLAVRREEELSKNWLDNNLMINASRCYRKGKQWQVDLIYFRNFFDPKRDK